METIFDVLTVTAFLAIAGAYFLWGQQDRGLLLRLLVAGLALAVANQAGNHDSILIGAVLLLAGTGYAVFAFRR